MSTIYINGKFTIAKITGVQRVAWELHQRLIEKLKDRGVTCQLLSPSKQIKKFKLRTLWANLWEQIVLPIRAGKYPLINLCNTAPILSIRKQFVLVHDAAVFDVPENYSRGYRTFAKFILQCIRIRTDALGTVSQFSQARIGNAFKIMKESIPVFHNGANHINSSPIDESILDRLGLRSAPYVLAVGSLQPGKNFKNLLLAMEHVCSGARLVVAGASDSVIFNTGIELSTGRAVAAGYVSDAQLSALYKNASVFVQASTYEGFGLPVLEAMALGAPVACSNAASLPEVCGDAALYFDPYSPSSIANRIDEIVLDRNLQNHLRTLGSQHVKNFDWDRTADLMADHICDQILHIKTYKEAKL